MWGKITAQICNQDPTLEIKSRCYLKGKAASTCVYLVFLENVIVVSTSRVIIIQINLIHILSMLPKPRIKQAKAARVPQVKGAELG